MISILIFNGKSMDFANKTLKIASSVLLGPEKSLAPLAQKKNLNLATTGNSCYPYSDFGSGFLR